MKLEKFFRVLVFYLFLPASACTSVLAEGGSKLWQQLSLCGYPLSAAVAIVASTPLRDDHFLKGDRHLHKLHIAAQTVAADPGR